MQANIRHAVALGCLVLSGCSKDSPAPHPPAQQLANPASVNCEKRGGQLAIRKLADGSEVGICSFPHGKQCEEWALYRNECKPE